MAEENKEKTVSSKATKKKTKKPVTKKVVEEPKLEPVVELEPLVTEIPKNKKPPAIPRFQSRRR